MLRTICSLILTFMVATAPAIAAGPKVLKDGQTPDDVRLKALKTLNDYFPFDPPASPDVWRQRAAELRRQVAVSQGVWPMPSKSAVEAAIHGKMDMGDYTVEKVYFQSVPGHYVTGNLYRPKQITGKVPGILSPHGHWPNGRFYDAAGGASDAKLAQQFAKVYATGAEPFVSSWRSPLQARCVQLARMGCIVFHYDMEGYADSVQFEHRPGVRPGMFRGAGDSKDSWGFFSPQAELRLQGMMGLQTWNSIRAMDFLTSLPDVDPQRLGVTGASGGGTQTMILAALDDRVDVSVPAVMVSTAMQGGCTCENANYLRVGTGNIEFAALFAPGPQALIAADDWTKELMTKGFPQLKELYRALGKPDHIEANALLQYGHNYNHPNREFAYAFFNKHFKLGHEDTSEHDFVYLTPQQLTVWNDEHKKPTGEAVGESHERKLTAWLTQDAQKQLEALHPKGAETLEQFRKVIGGAVETMIGRDLPADESVQWGLVHKKDHGGFLDMSGMLYQPDHQEHIPAAFFWPRQWNKQVVIWLDERGKSAMYNADGSPIAPVQRLIDAGYSVASLDMFGTGEFTPDGRPMKQQTMGQYSNGSAPWQKFSGYTFGYNHSLFARRVHDIMTMISFVKSYKAHPAEKVHLFALNGSGKWAAAATAHVGEHVDSAAIDTAGFRFDSIDSLDDADMWPGIVKYGDVPALLALSAPAKLWISGEGNKAPAIVADAYKAAGAGDKLTVFGGVAGGAADAAVDWLTK